MNEGMTVVWKIDLILMGWILLVFIGVAAALITLYMFFYKWYINNSLKNGTTPRLRMPSPRFMLVLVPVVLVISILVAGTVSLLDYFYDFTDRRTENMEEMLEQFSLPVVYPDPDVWQIETAMTERYGALMAWNEDMSDSHYHIFINEENGLPDYVFRYGGGSSSLETSVLLFEQEGNLILLSLNKPRIAQIECDNGMIYHVDPDKPFVLIIPDGGHILSRNPESLIMQGNYGYSGFVVVDENGDVVDLMSYNYFDMKKIP